MWYDFQVLLGRVQNRMVHMDRQDWIVVFVVLVVAGSFCLRGFGSRSSY
jgi:hypothetical protein